MKAPRARRTKVFVEDVNRWCMSSSYLSQCLRTHLRGASFRFVARRKDADLVVVNGCNIVPGNIEIAQDYKNLARACPDKKVIAFGCPPKLAPDGAAEPANFHVLSHGSLLRKPEALDALLETAGRFEFRGADEMLSGMEFVWGGLPLVAEELFYLRIADGCRSHCSYCAIRMAKGGIRSLPLAEILRRFKKERGRGGRKVVLLADDVACWGHDLGLNLGRLLGALVAADPSCKLVISNFNPEFLEPLWECLKPYWKNVVYLFLSIQSGNDRVLKLMGRDYPIAPVLARVREIRGLSPDIFIITHVIAGFPTETRSEYLDSVRAATAFDSVWLYRFIPFPFTPAWKLKGRVPEAEVRQRIRSTLRAGGKRFHDTSAARVP
jgi:tRNA A37 methylthiotransferase MiaB